MLPQSFYCILSACKSVFVYLYLGSKEKSELEVINAWMVVYREIIGLNGKLKNTSRRQGQPRSCAALKDVFTFYIMFMSL